MQLNPQLMPAAHRRRVGMGAALPTLTSCDEFVLFLNPQGATVADLQASFTWGSSIQGLKFTSNANTVMISGTWVGGDFAVPSSITVAHNFGGNTGWANIQALIESGIVTGKSTTGECASIQIHSPPASTIPLAPAVPVATHLPTSGSSTAGSTNTGTPASTTASSKTPYYIAGGVAVAALGAGAWWKWWRK